MILEFQTVDLACRIHRHKCQKLCPQLIPGRMKTAVSKSVSAFIRIQLCSRRHTARIPNHTVIVNVIIFSIGVHRYVIVAVSCDPHKFRIFIEAVSAAGV